MRIYLDFFGTLVDTADTSVSATAAILRRLSLPLGPENIYRHWKAVHAHLCRGEFATEHEIFSRGLKQTLEAFGYEIADCSVDEMIQGIESRLPFPGAVQAVAELSEHFALTIASNSDREPLMACMGPFAPYVDSVITSEDLRAYKPASSFFLQMLRRTGTPADEALYVGDSMVNDVLGARESGMRVILIDRAGPPRGTGGRSFTSFAACAAYLIANKSPDQTR